VKNLIFNKVEKYDNSLLVWKRGSGKTEFLIKYVYEYILNNKHKDILLLGNSKHEIEHFKRRFITNFINSPIIKKIKDMNISLINENMIHFNIINNNNIEFFLRKFNPELIIYEDLWDNILVKKLLDFSYLCKSKIIITTSKYDHLFLKDIDYYNNFYININKNDNFLRKQFKYKPHYLIDFDIKFERKLKLEKINKIRNGKV